MNYHPDDQDEIDRLHAEFIAVDEPNNEQVMAFQDASYALGLKRGQAHEAALQQRLNEADQRIDELEVNARRYEWLRRSNILAHVRVAQLDGSEPYVYAEALDESIDTIIAYQTKDSPEVGS